MSLSVSRDAQIDTIDGMVHDLVWHTQKQISHSLTQPEIDLTLPQLATLVTIERNGICRMSVLAEQTRQSAGTLTGIVDRLIADGLIERARSASDRRVIEVELTNEGRGRLQRAVNGRREDIQRALSRFDDEELEEFARLLNHFLGHLQPLELGTHERH